MRKQLFGVALLLSVQFLPGQAPPAGHHRPITFDEMIAESKQRGLSQVTLPAPTLMGTGIKTMEAIAGRFSVVIAEPVSTLVSSDDIMLFTWYTLRIDETLLLQPAESDLHQNVPPSLLPAPAGHVVLPLLGGTGSFDGVQVRQLVPEGLQLMPGKKYLLAVRLNKRTGAAHLGASEGAFEVDGEGLLHSLKPDNRLNDDARDRFSGSLDHVRTFLADWAKSNFK